jgi:hypothetical protein
MVVAGVFDSSRKSNRRVCLPTKTDYYGNDVTVRPGRHIWPDGWSFGQNIRADEIGFATYRIPVNSGGPIRDLACEVVVTGRTIQNRYGSYYVRVMIIFKGNRTRLLVVGCW